MSSDDGDLSCTDLYNAPHLGWADFSMTSNQAASRAGDDEDGWRASMGGLGVLHPQPEMALCPSAASRH